MTDPRLVQTVGGFVLRLAEQRPVPVIGLSGSQGSGKSTLAKTLAQTLPVAVLSLDDVYRTRAERQALAMSLHPLFATRGPPLTHDLHLLARTIEALREAGPEERIALPAFDKLADDRRPEGEWPIYTGRPKAIVLEGWCVGCPPQPDEALKAPVNALEAKEDPHGVWRSVINKSLSEDYARAWSGLDGWVHLKAPSFDVVLDWRCQQEEDLLGAPLPYGRREELARFIAHFERLTLWMNEVSSAADLSIALDENRSPVAN